MVWRKTDFATFFDSWAALVCRKFTSLKFVHLPVPFRDTIVSTHTASRRRFLRGLGTVMSLPFLESLAPRGFAAAKSAKPPVRMAFLYTPNGVNCQEWFPKGEGRGYQLSNSLKVIEQHRDDFSVVSGLCQNWADSHGNGGGDHARAVATFLTGCQPRKTAGADIKLGISADQIAAQQIGHLTRLPSLELSADGERSAGRCDSGYSCAYQFNLSWRSENVPMAPEMDPRLVFERLYGIGSSGKGPEAQRRQRMQKSVLDMVLGEARSLQGKANADDKRKLDEYFTSVREIEQRIERAEKFNAQMPDFPVPDGIPERYEEHIRTLFDLLALAFQTDSTRIASFMLAHDGSNRSFPEIGVPDSHHGISHHQRNPEKLRKIALIDQFYLRQLGYFIAKLKSIKDGDGDLLANSMVVYGGAISDPDRHDHDNLPVILAGQGGGTLDPGRHIANSGGAPMTNLYLSMLDRMGVKAEHVGDSSGRLENL